MKMTSWPEKFASMVLWGGMGFSAAVFLYALFRTGEISLSGDPRKYYAVSVAGIVAFGFALRCRERMKIRVALVAASTTFIVYAVEVFLSFSVDVYPKPLPKQDMAGIDPRSKFEVVMDLRSRGIEAYPVIYPEIFIESDGLDGRLKRLYPLASVSEKTIVYCPEGGEYVIQKSDEHGFNNPEGLHKAGEVDVVLLGDSFTHGACVNPGEDVAGQLRKNGRRVLNLGSGGSGPLIELATLKEYAEPLRPKVVLWLYYENDLTDLLNEKRSALLLQYLNKGFSQNLLDRQKVVDELLINFIEGKIKKGKARTEERTKKEKEGAGIFHSPLARIVKLTNWRFRLGMVRLSPPAVDPLFSEILGEARDRVRSWGGRLHFVYLPMARNVMAGNYFVAERRKQVLALVQDLEIPIVDFFPVVSAEHDLLSLYLSRRWDFHYNLEGNSLLAQTIEAHLNYTKN
ncbi:MAG: SGNH/GDSL hydrolase family protein [Chloroflexi bacterium]|nr:SGNH/GDSL hydrolase family protein [Chloroflexota bacterium]